MSNDIFEQLSTYVDSYGMGIGKKYNTHNEATELFKVLFTEEEANVFLAMKPEFESAEQIGKRLAQDAESLEKILYEMSLKGLIFRQKIDGVRHYRQNAFAHGMAEFNIDNILNDRATAMALGAVSKGGSAKAFYEQEDPLHRCLPISADVVEGGKLLPGDDWRKIIDEKERFSVDRCVCQMMNPACTCEHGENNRLVNRCLAFDSFADYRVENGIGKYISKEEAIKLIEDCIADGITVSPANAEIVEVFCMCHAGCCGQYLAAKAFPGAAIKNVSNYFNVHDSSKCINCGKCVRDCCIGALKLEDGKLTYNKDLCFGCGLCVQVCPVGANILRVKSDAEIYTPPKGTWHDVFTYQQKKRELIAKGL